MQRLKGRRAASRLPFALPMAMIIMVSGPSAADEPASLATGSQWNALEFRMQVIDDRSGDVKMVGDIDGDGFVDLVIGGEFKEGLVWYRAPDWHPYLIARPEIQFTTDAALGDVDGDGDLDIVVPDGQDGRNLVWFENPLANGGDPTDGPQWRRHPVGAVGDWGKDVKLADFDGDGRLDIATRSHVSVMIFFQNADGSWMHRRWTDLDIGHEGLGLGDLDGDGIQDLVIRGAWVKNPGGTKARSETWQSYPIGSAPENFKVAVADIDQDGRLDVVYSSSEDVADIAWYRSADGDPLGPWKRNLVLPLVEKAHTIAAGDLDGDGDLDLVVGQMHTSRDGLIAAVYNVDGVGGTWQRQVIGEGGVHNGVLADLDADGDLDLYGANWVTNPPVRLWINTLDPARERLRLDRWTVAASIQAGGQGCTPSFTDLDGDGMADVACGTSAWLNPGGDLTGAWRSAGASPARGAAGEGADALPAFPDLASLSIADLNRDDMPDVIAAGRSAARGLYILADHGNGRRGLQRISAGNYVEARAADLDADGDLDIVALSSGKSPSLHVLRNDAMVRDP
ncbi:MAG TPA: VCBS repeat-containing protein [Sinorhizobium sp.]|nr:VCBS repeat-containing protein [Sinorhizobium sp.]